MKSRNAVYIRVLLVVLAIVILLAFLNRSPERTHHDTWLPSSYNPVGAGSMAFYETLEELNWPVARWREPLGRLANEGTGNVLIITRSPVATITPFSDQELGILDKWVKGGNTLLLLGALDDGGDTRSFLNQLGFVAPEHRTDVTDFLQSFNHKAEEPITLAPAPQSSQSGTMILPPTRPLPIAFPKNARLLWELDGQPYVVDVPLGQGHVICGASEQLLSNRFLPRGDNLAVVLRLIAPGGVVPRHVFFEESHNGYSAGFAMVRLLEQPGVRFAGMLALLGALAFVGSSLVRFGPILPLERETGRSTLEFIDSIADLYLRADQRNDTMRFLFNETHQRLLLRLHLPATASHELIASRLERAHPHLPKWKKLARRFDSPEYTEGLPPTGWLRVAKDLIEIKSAMA